MLFLSLLLQLCLTGFSLADRPCLERYYGNGGTVCVCNLTYCDTVPKIERQDEMELVMFTSNKAGLRFYQSQANFVPNGNPLQNPNIITIDSEQKYQTILGFGGALTDSAGINIMSLHPNLQKELLKSYFSEEGIEFNILRIPMGGSDFSTRAYSYDDGEPDPDLDNFKLAPEDFNYKIPVIQEALELNKDLILYASAWAAPRWMKTNHDYRFGFLKLEHYQTWANYFLKFLDLYQEQGVMFWGITTGNEPTNIIPGMEVINWVPTALGKWIRDNLGPTLRTSKYSKIKIITLDDQRFLLPWFVQVTLNDSKAREYVDGIGVHSYFDTVSPNDLLCETHEAFPEKFILNTEASMKPPGNRSAGSLGYWTGGEMYSYDIIEDLNNWSTGWMDWNLVLDLTGGPSYINNMVEASIIVNAAAGEFYKQPAFYHLAHFSKFIPRGSVRIHSKIKTTTGIHGVALRRPDNATVVVLLNRSPETTVLTIADTAKGTVKVELGPYSINTVLYG